MINGISAFIIATAIFLALLSTLSMSRAAVSKSIRFAFFVSMVGGLLYYSMAFGAEVETPADMPAAAFKALAATAEMFTGNDHFDEITEAGKWILVDPASRAVYWLLHVLAVYATASALLAALGKELIRKLRYKFHPYNEVYLFYHVNDGSLRLAQESAGNRSVRILFIDETGDSEKDGKVRDVGGFIIDEENFNADDRDRWLRFAGIRKNDRHILRIICLSDDDPGNKAFLHLIRRKLRNAEIAPRQVNISVRTTMFLQYSFLTNSTDPCGETYNIHVFTPWKMTARLLMTMAPLYKTVGFDGRCHADRDVNVLILGFGHMGQEMYRELIANGQFPESRFRAVIADRKIEARRSQFTADYPYIPEAYKTEFRKMEIPSEEFTSLLKEALPDFNYIAVCCGSPEENDRVIEIIRQYQYAHPQKKSNKCILVQCHNRGGMVYDCATDDKCEKITAPFADLPSFYSDYDRVHDMGFESLTDENVLRGRADLMAYAVNAVYAQEAGADPDDSWLRLDHYSRSSSRASADFVPAMLAAAGIKQEQADEAYFEEIRKNDPELLTEMGRMEHLRWNAFQISSGVIPMTVDDMRSRAAAGEKKIQKDIPSWIIGGRHVCIMDWDGLDALSEEYSRLTGTPTDYKQMDINNVMNIPKILRIYGNIENKKR